MNTSERRAGTILIVGSYDHDSGAATALAGIQSLVDNESAQVHGADTGAPALARTEYAAANVAPGRLRR